MKSRYFGDHCSGSHVKSLPVLRFWSSVKVVLLLTNPSQCTVQVSFLALILDVRNVYTLKNTHPHIGMCVYVQGPLGHLGLSEAVTLT